jgi:excisionase family DNA binding protein
MRAWRRLVKLMSTTEAAEFLGLHESTLLARARAGIVRGYKPGRAWRFKEQDLLDYLETTCPSTNVPSPSIGGAKLLSAAKRLDDRLAQRRSPRPGYLKTVSGSNYGS